MNGREAGKQPAAWPKMWMTCPGNGISMISMPWTKQLIVIIKKL